MDILIGINPIREALRAGRPLDRVLIAKGAGGQRVQEIVDHCRKARVPVRFEARDVLERASNGQAHQGLVAYCAQARYAEPEAVLKNARLLVVLDGVEDPHNLGAVIRTANAAGAAAVIIGERRAAGLTETVAKSAAGALEYTPVVRVVNITRTLEELKTNGFWIYGLDERGETLHYEADFAVPTVLVLGGEGKGLHQLVQKHCDFLIRIPMAGAISSLNVSVAAGVVMFEWARRQARREGQHSLKMER